MHGSGLSDGNYRLFYAIQAGGNELSSGEADVKAANGHFDIEIALKDKYPTAKGISWRLLTSGSEPKTGYSPLAWSRFSGRVRYKQNVWHSTYIELVPIQ